MHFSLSNTFKCRLSFSGFFFFYVTGDGDEDFGLYPADILDDVCGSDADPTLSLALAEDPASPPLSDDESSTQHPFSSQHTNFFLPQEDLTIPMDFELRESSVPGGGLGIWSHRKVNIGERFGPYEGEHRPRLQDPNQGWEVKTYSIFLAFDPASVSFS